jgi:hypothetical protein
MLDKVQLVAGEQHRGAVAGMLAQDGAQVVDPDGVKARERLVEDQQLRIVDERASELNPLLVAQRQLLDLRLGPLAETEPFALLLGGAPSIAGLYAV